MEGDLSGKQTVLVGTGRPKLSRRSFLLLSALTGAAGAVGVGLGAGTGKVYTRYERKVEQDRVGQAIAAQIDAGTFRFTEIGPQLTLEAVRDAIVTDTQKLEGIEESSFMIIDSKNGIKATRGDVGAVQPDFVAASIIKVPVIYYAMKASAQDNKLYVTDDIARRMLKNSDNDAMKQMVLSLPIAQGKTEGEAIRAILQAEGIEPQGTEAPLRVRLQDMAAYGAVVLNKVPSLIEPYFSPLMEDNDHNHGASAVILPILKRLKKDAPKPYFKIGYFGEYETYLYRIGSTTLVGYAKGSNEVSRRHQMLQALAATTHYALTQ